MILSMQEKKAKQKDYLQRKNIYTELELLLCKSKYHNKINFYRILIGQIKLLELYARLRCSSCQGNRNIIKSAHLMYKRVKCIVTVDSSEEQTTYISDGIYQQYFSTIFLRNTSVANMRTQVQLSSVTGKNTNAGKRPGVFPWYARVTIWGVSAALHT